MAWVIVSEQQTVDATPEEVWRLVGPGYVDISSWASTVRSSERLDGGTPPGGAPAPGRRCDVVVVGSTEQPLLDYDADARRLEYGARGARLDRWLTDVTDAWSLEATGDGRTRVISRVRGEVRGPLGPLLAPVLSFVVGRVVGRTLDDLARRAGS